MTTQPIYGYSIDKDVMVPMRDGVRLATDIYRPAHGDGRPVSFPVPVLLVRTSYDKSAPEWDDVWPYYARHGYAFAIQDLRSRFRSEGDGHYYHTCNPWEGVDGYDTVEWLAAQEWSNGKIGTLGSSHRAIVQTQLALERPPHLAAMWVEAGPTNIYAHEAREGGAMSPQMFAALHLHALDSHELRGNPDGAKVILDAMRNMTEEFGKVPWKPGETALRVTPDLEKTVFDYYHRGAYDEWWNQECCNQEPYFDRHADVPIVVAGGWYDAFVGASCNYFVEMNRRNESPARLILGPWCHGAMRAEASWHGQMDVGEDSVWTNSVYNPERLRWFDRFLRDEPVPVEHDPPVRLFVMGTGGGGKTKRGHLDHGGYWRDENEWPLARTSQQTLYLQRDGSLVETTPSKGTPPLEYVFDPDNPVPTVGGTLVGAFRVLKPEEGGPPEDFVPDHLDQWALARANLAEAVAAGGWHQEEGPQWAGAKPPYQRLCDRDDVLTFRTEPLASDTEVTGEIEVSLWVSSDAPDTDFTVKIIDEYPPSGEWPDGFDLNLVDTMLRMRYRESWSEEKLMTPGEVYPITIKLWPISNVFKAGHRLRLDVSSSNYPRLDVNPNTGEPIGRHTHTQKARNSVFVDADRPSSISLPIIES